MKRLRQEYRMLSKPTPKELWHSTWTMILIAVVGAAVVSGFDIALTSLLRLIV